MTTISRIASTTAAAFAAALAVSPPLAMAGSGPVDTGCPKTSTPSNHVGSTLKSFVAAKSGAVYDGVDASVKLEKEGGIFSTSFFAASGTPQYTCPGDFDEDGWMDFIGGTSDGMNIGLFINNSDSNLVAYPPDWTNPNYKLPPLFTRTGWIYSSTVDNGGGGMAACADFDNDGNMDFAMIFEKGDDGGVANFGKMFRGKGNGTFFSPYDLTTDIANHFYDIKWDGNLVATDYNGDNRIDFLFPSSDAGGGFVRVFLNDGAASPRFTPSTYLLQNAGLGTTGVQGVAYADFTGDGRNDLAVSGKSSDKVYLYPGLSGGGVSSTAQVMTATMGAALLPFADYSLDGRPDLITATDGNNGVVQYFKNNGTSTPFVGVTPVTLTETFTDFDTGFAFDYDNDPDHTVDLMLADGNGAGYSVFANRVVSLYVQCAEVKSGELDLGALASEEMVVTSARLTPNMTLAFGTTVTFYMSNENPENWRAANPCTDKASDMCVSFPTPSGRSVRWKAVMCSDTTKTRTPKITGVEIKFDYTPAELHLRGGVVVHDGVVYAGAFKQPGDRGHFYALNAGLDETYWDAAKKLDAMSDSSRTVYTATQNGKTRLDFATSTKSKANLNTTLGSASLAQTNEVITWQRSARFGLIGGGHTPTRLGSIVQSTPAVLSPPAKPSWFEYMSASEKSLANAFVSDNEDRPLLVLFGSKDGALHAVRNDPDNITASANGTEAWAFVPAKVASQLIANKTSGTVTAYPDGSPTLADVVLGDGKFHTVAIVGGGNGGSSVFALDVTETINPSSGAVLGPTPLWEVIPGDATAGQGLAKPAIARVNVNGVQRFIAILGTGIASDNLTAPYTKGRDIVAYDIATGARMWRFQSACPLTSDLITFETDDSAEPGKPAVDGYIDRLVFADSCGFVYKLDPAVELLGTTKKSGWINTSGMGTINTGTVDALSRPVFALFSTKLTAGGLGEERPIAGTIGARPDESGRSVLYFGTGGIESYNPAAANAFYAVYADSGAIRSKIAGTCSNNLCEKFYGGVVVSPEQVFMTRAVDPPIGTATCDLGSASAEGLDLDTLGSEFKATTSSATVSSLYGHGGAIYLTTLGGSIDRVGVPVGEDAGSEPDGQGTPGGDDDGGDTGGIGALQMLGWRQVF